MISHHGFTYRTKQVSVLGFSMMTINDLDESIDMLCAHFGEDNEDQSLKEEYCPYFGVLWESGIGLAQRLNLETCNQKKILELGCGLALPSFVATCLGGNVLACDFHSDVPLFLKTNQQNNNLFFDFKLYNWRKAVGLKSFDDNDDLGKFELILGSDILYENSHPVEIATALTHFLAPGGKIILADPGRAYIQTFVTAMTGLGFNEKLSVQKVDASLTTKKIEREVYLFEFTRRVAKST